MTTSKLLHQDDGGTVTLFGGADKQMLFACTGGHYWIVKATKMGSATEPETDRGAGDDSDGDAAAAEPAAAALAEVEAIRRDFGDAAVSMMNL